MSKSTIQHLSADEFLLSRFNFEERRSGAANPFKLDEMRRFLAELSDPQAAVPIVHIAGTKGKGSTTEMLSAILSAAGLTCGAYTSPHLFRIEERLRINGVPCPTERFQQLIDRVRPIVSRWDAEERHHLTFFELTTAVSLLYFAEQKVDLVLLEVGLGGRLDSTNICAPEVAVITSISYDHMDQLGSTLSAIAGEKAGIIKPKKPIVSGVVCEEPKSVISNRAAELQAPLSQLGHDFLVEYQGTQIQDGRPLTNYRYESEERKLNGSVALAGEHQAVNAAVAIRVCEILQANGWPISDGHIVNGLTRTKCAARIEVLQDTECPIVIDAAHNPASVEALINVLEECYPEHNRILVFATSRDKDSRAMLKKLTTSFNEIIFTRFQSNPRGESPSTLMAIATELGSEASVVESPALALQAARQCLKPKSIICCAGSFFLAAEIKPLIALAAEQHSRVQS